ncbi:cytidylate kinase [Clostridium saccharoperbutylacetonicum]|uniref:Cytidylate kinase n=1 Tax=Clostridium saccharoperbutylacetonicum N1-4(HMT) TaxID=931276 RepID=M1MGK7_9CLOT|nr:(d)CMP kinase [Clostridium saccharoperbutylacetonicum]AGF57059.1 cytidylate kinase Cmk [Clostridium saccharoperbutylacetonicum N1-4(HMT)]NRT62182.1 cytidylate kinase [Clostridium saccharoperbutylacetonicum]NSB25513.1 cytidylate kinase [Clostridium saccharoperbutylacetonicum]NSB44883.1 cytidylate kinase [Clostridium saccharoperbutylacetonicum]
MKISVAIDGPAGAGKSTIAKLVGKEYNLMYINTGAMYRAVALKAAENNLSPEQINEICSIVNDMEMHFENDDLILNGENVQDQITTPEISNIVSNYASIPEVRTMLVKLQRDMSYKFNVIMDGRDIGTVVLEDANFKFFLTASPEERANRRFKELNNRNIECSYDQILQDIIERDYKDTHRATDPLRKADDAIEIDTTSLDINGVVRTISEYIKKGK